MTEERESLPPHWITVTVGELGKVITGNTPSKADPENYGQYIPFVKPPELTNRIVASAEDGLSKIGSEKARILPANSILVSCIGNLGKTALNSVPVAFNQQINAIVPFDGVEPKFVFYQVQSFSFAKQLEEQASATTISIVNKGKFQGIACNLAPQREQKRIVAKIEELFSELDKGIEVLSTARQQLSLYRHSVLTHAFEGKLTENWRKSHKSELRSLAEMCAHLTSERQAHHKRLLATYEADLRKWEKEGKKGIKPSRVHALEPVDPLPREVQETLPDLPDGWTWQKLAWMTCGVEYGTAAKSTKTGAVPVIRMGNLQSGRIDWTDLVFTSDADEIAQYSLRPGDVLFNRTNSPELVGKTATYRGERSALFAGYLIRVNHNTAVVDSQYLNLFLNSHIARKHGDTVKTDGVNQSNINGEKLQNYPFPFCSVAEQQEIVRLLDEKLSHSDQLLSEIDDHLVRANALRQSILKRAFSGQLVAQDAQDATDEPASALLARIRAEREKSEPKKKRNGKNGKKNAA